MRSYAVAVRYRRAGEVKLRWFYGQAYAPNKLAAEMHGRESFRGEFPDGVIVAVFVSRVVSMA